MRQIGRDVRLSEKAIGVGMRTFTAVIERCPETQLFVGYVPGFPGAHSQGETVDELRENITEVIAMLLEDGEPEWESRFVGTETVQVASASSSLATAIRSSRWMMAVSRYRDASRT